MKSKYSMGIGLVVLVVVALILWPKGRDLERFNKFYERGQYEVVCTHLDKALQKNPDWHEARDLLIRAALKGDRPDLALAHMTEMARAGASTAHFEMHFDIWLSEFEYRLWEQLYSWLEEQIGLLPKEKRDPWLEQLQEGRYDRLDGEFLLWQQEQYNLWLEDFQDQEVPKSLLAAAAEGYALGHWEWIREVYLELLCRFGQAEEIPRVMEEILAVQDNVIDIWRAWSAVEQAGNYQALWELSTFLDNRDQSQFRQTALSRLGSDAHVLGQLAAKYPGDAFLAAAWAQERGPEEGLDFLRQWEVKHEVDAGAQVYYSAAKAYLLVDLELPDKEDFLNITSSRLLQVGAEWLGQPEICNLVLDFLAQVFPHEVGILRAGLKGQEPSHILEGHSSSLSPDETMLSYYDSGLRLYDLMTQKIIELDMLDIETDVRVKWMWKPDSRGVAVNAFWVIVDVFDRSGKRQGESLFVSSSLDMLGWDNGNLLVSTHLGTGRSMLLYNPDTGEYELVEPEVPSDWDWTVLFPGPCGNWASQDTGRSIIMLRDEEVYGLESMNMRIVSWLPDGSGLLLSQPSEKQRFYLWRGEEPENLEAQGRFLGWKSEEEFYWARDFDIETQDIGYVDFYFSPMGARPNLGQLMGYNIKTHEERDYKLTGNWECAVGNTVVSEGMKIRIYTLP